MTKSAGHLVLVVEHRQVRGDKPRATSERFRMEARVCVCGVVEVLSLLPVVARMNAEILTRNSGMLVPVSYTHLTLPTILLV